jgi:hypothetical protein
MLGEALQTQEAIWLEDADSRHVEQSKYIVCRAGNIHNLPPLSLLIRTDHLRRVPALDSDVLDPTHNHCLLVDIHTRARRIHTTDVRQCQDSVFVYDATR